MRKMKLSVICLLLGSSITLSSCIGSFSLWNNLKSWNESLGDKFLNEIVFLAFNIVPVYSVAYFADAVLLNSIEFWTGNNPLESSVGTVKAIHGNKGEYLVETLSDGYAIQKKGDKERIELKYDKVASTWRVAADGQSYEVARINADGSVTVKNAQGEELTVQPNVKGVAQVQAFTTQGVFVATR